MSHSLRSGPPPLCAKSSHASHPAHAPTPGARTLPLVRPAILDGDESPDPHGCHQRDADSFSDGGQFGDPDSAIAHGKRLIAEGAAILDVGGESTRPGAEPVAEAEELARVVPVVEGLVADRSDQQISIDTAKLAVAEAALAAGATVVNDVTAFQATLEMAGLVAERGAALERRSNATLSGRYLRRSTRRLPAPPSRAKCVLDLRNVPRTGCPRQLVEQRPTYLAAFARSMTLRTKSPFALVYASRSSSNFVASRRFRAA